MGAAGRRRLLMAGGSTTYATWNASDKSTNVSLSGSDLIATATSGSPTSWWKNVRSDLAITGKTYFEITGSSLVGGKGFAFGIANDTDPINDFWLADTGVDGFMMYNSDGDCYYQNGVVKNMASFTTVTIGIAVNVDDHLLYYRDSGGWRGSDPSTPSGGIDISALSGQNIHAGVSLEKATNVATLNAGASAFAYSVPSGYKSGIYT